MSSKIKTFLITIILCALLALTIGFLIKKLSKKPSKQETPPRPVQVAKATQKDVPVYIDSFGTLTSPNNVDITSQVTGKIMEVHFKEGDEVSQGNLLFSIDPREYQADLDKAEASLAEDTVSLKLKKDTLERNRKLVEKSLISEQEFENYQTDVSATEAQIQLDKANIETAKINLEYCQIRSPINGVTGIRLVDPGYVVTGNCCPALVNIQTMDPLYVDFSVTELKLPAIRDNMDKGTLQVQFTVAGDEKGPYTGELQLVNNTVDNTTGTISLRATVANKERQLWPGQFVRIKLTVSTLKNAVIVPEVAVRLGQKGPYLYVINQSNEAELREKITQGPQEDDIIVIKEGIKAGEQVVTFGQLGLYNGAKVSITSGKKEESGDKS